jgi:hypothetical protein
VSLLNAGPVGVPAAPDAIIVPSHRPVGSLAHAFQMAGSLRCPLVVLWTDRQGSVAELDSLPRSGVAAAVVHVPRAADPLWLPQRSGAVAAAARSRNLEASTKRNLGLLLARLVGWQRVLFSDDDTSRLSARDALIAVGSLTSQRAAIFRMVDYPDNSVVCHAARRVGLPQDVFVSGSMVVRVDGGTPFFPPVYNEDWLFCFDALAAGQVRYAGELRQEHYDPFQDPRRAAQEEFGDVLGEGLMSLLHLGWELADADHGYWRQVLRHRRVLLDLIEEALPLARVDPPARARMAASLQAARAELDRLDADVLLDFVGAWRSDLQIWHHDVARITPLPGRGSPARRIETALTALGLGSHLVWASWL